MNEALEDLIIAEMPSSFLKQLAESQPVIYEEAADLARKSPSWREPEALFLIPHFRRALFEHAFRLAAGNARGRLRHFDCRHAGDNCGYGRVQAKRLVLTIHHVDGPDQFVRPCVSRRQNAAVNKFLDSSFMPDAMIEIPPDLSGAEFVNAYILHGQQTRKKADKTFTEDFLRIAFPDSELNRYTRNYNVLDVLQKYAVVESAAETAAIEDKARPVLNPNKKKKISDAEE
ncbi:MAG: hypothetical protein WD733_01030 [Bryobacterales bacterium]